MELSKLSIFINLTLTFLSLVLNFHISNITRKEKEKEKREKKESLKLNIIKIMEYNSTIFKEMVEKNDTIIYDELIVLKNYSERLAILGDELQGKINGLYSYFLKIEKKKFNNNNYFEKNLIKFLKTVPEEEVFYFLDKQYIEPLLILKNKKNKYVSIEENGHRIKIEKRNINTFIDKQGVETGKSIFKFNFDDYRFIGKVQKNVLIEGKINCNSYEFEGEIKDYRPYTGYIKVKNNYPLQKYKTEQQIDKFNGEIIQGEAYTGFGIVDGDILPGLITDPKRLEKQKEWYFNKDLEWGTYNEIPDDVQKEFDLLDELSRCSELNEYVLERNKIQIEAGEVKSKEIYSYNGLREDFGPFGDYE
ncbi:MAG: hypothetical protein ACRDDH_01985 [Cetobacterium sp.]|uniref:hypothetical protein n=1 Tax=Cetobacterium sp. TaxID=2071632 RepID=UPI003EE79416